MVVVGLVRASHGSRLPDATTVCLCPPSIQCPLIWMQSVSNAYAPITSCNPSLTNPASEALERGTPVTHRKTSVHFSVNLLLVGPFPDRFAAAPIPIRHSRKPLGIAADRDCQALSCSINTLLLSALLSYSLPSPLSWRVSLARISQGFQPEAAFLVANFMITAKSRESDGESLRYF